VIFLERLQGICDRVDGALAVTLVDRDGIMIESHVSNGSIDLEALAAELLAQTRTIARDHRELEMGELRQLAVTTDRYTVLLGSLIDDYSLLLVLRNDGSFGRARYELRRALLQFESDLI
jgi:predicted regulator of Ras-like GTPase activity (Roadblock/LC7/MglB family)